MQKMISSPYKPHSVSACSKAVSLSCCLAPKHVEHVANSQPLVWFPMRVTYNRELKVKEQLDMLGIENFVPMKYDWIEQQVVLVPAVHNLIFVHSTQEKLTSLKMSRKEFTPLRYMTKPSADGRGHVIMHVPERQMSNFMRVASVMDSSVTYLKCNDFISKVGRKVRITDGLFKDVEGVIKRIKKNKYVVVQIDGVAAVAITYVPACWLAELADNSQE